MNAQKRAGIRRIAPVAVCIGVSLAMQFASAGNVNNVVGTKHNLSSASTNTVKADPGAGVTTDQTCVFCHTPHGASTNATFTLNPLWNRQPSGASYQLYNNTASASMDAAVSQPEGTSKLCLSCHDGTISVGAVNVLGGRSNQNVGMLGTQTGVNAGKLLDSGDGYTRNLGIDLRNDHPISFSYNVGGTAADNDDLRRITAGKYTVGAVDIVASRAPPAKYAVLPLEATNVQCGTCHDPHVRDTSLTVSSKFLRTNRFQKTQSPGAGSLGPTGTPEFDQANDIICLGCHKKEGWSISAHAHDGVATAQYGGSVDRNAEANAREFPTTGFAVWQAGCLNCHDTHTAPGQPKLLRLNKGSGAILAGVAGRMEDTCYQCHSSAATSVLATAPPDVRTEFGKTVRMPIERAGHEIQSPGKLLLELGNAGQGSGVTDPRGGLGKYDTAPTNPPNRHVECTDCHNPHTAVRGPTFNVDPATYRTTPPTERTRVLSASAKADINSNVASGPLRGAWGVEPTWTATDWTTFQAYWPMAPTSYTRKEGLPTTTAGATDKSQPWLTREYQLCFKCHSDYALNWDRTVGGSSTTGNVLTTTNMPNVPYDTGGTATTEANSMSKYTNVAAEFAVNAADTPTTSTDMGEAGGDGSLTPVPSYPGGTNNHRSWHPVVFPTGRNRAERRMAASGATNIRPPFDTNIGNQTMYCSDCHGGETSWTAGTGHNTAQTQGPHGSAGKFLLRASGTSAWDRTNTTIGSPGFCGNCHAPTSSSGFAGNHNPCGDMGTNIDCMACHIAVPHGWKNKAFLVNLFCAGPEAGQQNTCTNIGGTGHGRITAEPYYVDARLRIVSWNASGGWTGEGPCDGNGNMDGCPR